MNTSDESHQAMIDDETPLKEYIVALERLLKTRDEMLEVIPPCADHGNQCVPHALEWIKKAGDALELWRKWWDDNGNPYYDDDRIFYCYFCYNESGKGHTDDCLYLSIAKLLEKEPVK